MKPLPSRLLEIGLIETIKQPELQGQRRQLLVFYFPVFHLFFSEKPIRFFLVLSEGVSTRKTGKSSFEAVQGRKCFILSCCSHSHENFKIEFFIFCFFWRSRWKGEKLVAFPREVIVFCNSVYYIVTFSLTFPSWLLKVPYHTTKAIFVKAHIIYMCKRRSICVSMPCYKYINGSW